MTFRKLSNLQWTVALTFFIALCPALFAQGPDVDAPAPSVEAISPVMPTSHGADFTHKFLDKQNRALFIAAAAFNGADFAVTRSNLQSGGQELNPLVRVFGRSTPGLALNFAGETAGVITFSYFLHKTGHHNLERLVSIVNLASSAGAVTYGLEHR